MWSIINQNKNSPGTELPYWQWSWIKKHRENLTKQVKKIDLDSLSSRKWTRIALPDHSFFPITFATDRSLILKCHIFKCFFWHFNFYANICQSNLTLFLFKSKEMRSLSFLKDTQNFLEGKRKILARRNTFKKSW